MNSNIKYSYKIESDKIKQQAIKYIEKYTDKINIMKLKIISLLKKNLIFVFVKILQYKLYYITINR